MRGSSAAAAPACMMEIGIAFNQGVSSRSFLVTFLNSLAVATSHMFHASMTGVFSVITSSGFPPFTSGRFIPAFSALISTSQEERTRLINACPFTNCENRVTGSRLPFHVGSTEVFVSP